MSEAAVTAPAVEYTTRIEDGETEIDVTGDTEVAVVIQSESGERVYFPPEDISEEKPDPDDDSPYQPSGDSPYQPNEEEDEISTRGVTETRTGFKITHPEPAAEITVLRQRDADTDA